MQLPFRLRSLVSDPVSAVIPGGGDHRVHSDPHRGESLRDRPAGRPRRVQEAVWIHALLQAGGGGTLSNTHVIVRLHLWDGGVEGGC